MEAAVSNYRNRLESKVAKTLDAAFRYEALRLPYVTRQHYLPDFIDTEGKRIVEGKGRFPAADRTKMKAIREQYPDYEITIVFQNPDAPINKGSKTTNAMWCEKHGIKWLKA